MKLNWSLLMVRLVVKSAWRIWPAVQACKQAILLVCLILFLAAMILMISATTPDYPRNGVFTFWTFLYFILIS